MNRIWQCIGRSSFSCNAMLSQPSHQLDGKERVAPGTLHDPLPNCLVQPCRQPLNQVPCLGLTQRFQRQSREVLPASTPGGSAFQQFWPTEHHNEEGHPGTWVHDVLNQIE